MNKLLALTSFLFVLNSYSQSDTLFPNVTANWSVKGWTWSWDGEFTWNYSLHYNVYMGEDTAHYNGEVWNNLYDFDGIPKGLIRTDSGKVYYKSLTLDYPFAGEIEVEDSLKIELLYDFNLTIGDTAYWGAIGPVTVVNKTVSNFLTVEKPTLELSNGDTWVQGVGSNQGLFRPLFKPFEYGLLFCGYEGFYKSISGDDYSLTLTDQPTQCTNGIEDPEEEDLLFYPNPADTYVNVFNKQQETTITIIDMTGKIVLSELLQTGENQIDLTELNAGFYILKTAQFTEILTIK